MFMQQNKLSFWITIVTCILVVLCSAPSAFAQGGSISGRITDTDGAPIPNVQVEASASPDPCDFMVLAGSDFTDINGYYTVGVPAGTFYVKTWSRPLNYLDKSWDGATGSTDCDDGEIVTVTAGQDTGGINMSLELGGSISGRITAINGDPISDGVVQAFTDKCGGTIKGAGMTDSQGYYTIYGLEAGTAYVKTLLFQSKYVDKIWDGVIGSTDCLQGEAVTVTVGQDTGGINISMSEPITSTGGTVSLPDGSASVFFPPDAIPDEVFVSIVQAEETSVPPQAEGLNS